VTDTSSVTTSQTWVPSDSATVHSTGGAALSGSVVFTLYSNGTCTAGAENVNVLYTSAAKPVSGAAGVDVTVQSGDPGVSVTATGVTTWSWQAVYTSSNSTSGSTGPCESTTLNIDND